MQAWEAIRSRRDVRDYEDRPLAEDHLNEILEAGRRSPSAANWQPWDFVVVTDKSLLSRLAKVAPSAGAVAKSAATIALIAPATDNERWLGYDLGQASMSIMLAAAGLAIGSGHAGVDDQDLARELLRFPDDRFCAYLITLGYPAGRPLSIIRDPDRRPFDDVVHRDGW